MAISHVPIKASGHCNTCPKWQYRLHALWDGVNARYYCADCCPVCHPPPPPPSPVAIEAEHAEGPVETIQGEQGNLFG